jgi:hypothetical protein
MRLVKQIPHERYLIQIHQYNGKYILKVELGGYEQLFKISETEVDFEKLQLDSSNDFLKNCLDRFISMRSDWENLISNK